MRIFDNSKILTIINRLKKNTDDWKITDTIIKAEDLIRNQSLRFSEKYNLKGPFICIRNYYYTCIYIRESDFERFKKIKSVYYDEEKLNNLTKLFQYFIKQLNPSSIISYCDKAKFSGYVYEAIGMTHIRATQPSEIWSRGKEKVTTRLLLARGYDQLFNAHYGKGTDNKELMKNDGWLPVFDCGQSVYEWKSSQL